ncbi:hypothetical protein PENNAL_c0247G06664, partial [Penicillium nalgiovense]
AYTDGSKTENGGVGASVVTSRGNATARLNDQDTVYAAELKGILLALGHIKDDLVRELVATSRAPARVHGNERADILAKLVASAYRPAEAVILLSGCRTKLRELAAKRWKEEWASNNSGAHLRALFPKPTKAIFAIHESIRRAASSVLVQMQTGKISLPAYLAALP